MTEPSTTSDSVPAWSSPRTQRLDCLVMTDRSWSQRQDLLQPHIGARFRKLRLDSGPGQCRKVESRGPGLGCQIIRQVYVHPRHTHIVGTCLIAPLAALAPRGSRAFGPTPTSSSLADDNACLLVPPQHGAGRDPDSQISASTYCDVAESAGMAALPPSSGRRKSGLSATAARRPARAGHRDLGSPTPGRTGSPRRRISLVTSFASTRTRKSSRLSPCSQ